MAAITWRQTVDANRMQLLSPVIHPNAGAPAPTPEAGQVWYDTSTGKFMYRDGVAGANVDPRARATHTGTQAASTISDLAAVVQAYRLDQFAAPTASLNFNSQKGINAATPTTGTDVANKDYVDNALSAALAGTTFKTPVRVATTANITLSGTQTIDGVAVIATDRVLVKNQSTAADNGIYVVAAGAWSRATDADAAAELPGGTVVAVDEGTANNNTMWMLAADVITLGSTAQTWTQFGAGSTYTASLGVQLVGNDFRANLGTGLTLSGNQIVPDYAQIMRRKVATGFVGTTGADVAVAHNFALSNKCDVQVSVYEDSTGIKIDCGVVCTDVNTVTLSFAVAPTTNQYRYVMVGVS